ncbi:predicted protein [Sclerotinia sclerotiorum 1980 UF-70]|uniref:Uncharacterized protein n=1 Tax=Sclerotinia sclerotiorum (strain ATCC 18683 / 1980 / Ss-1) TaxID=665079 RepID=A7EKU4_SCLS1|nr:predicted protein [Sclerotinia sclerotiorum 1980 UF-70]EDO03460.1 predicted protein [Sclerotinia sclerotiorum 1980 UF-70]
MATGDGRVAWAFCGEGNVKWNGRSVTQQILVEQMQLCSKVIL